MLVIGFVVFDIPGILGLPAGIYVLSSEIFFRSHPPAGLPDYGGISALATSFLLILLALSWYYHRQTRRSQRYVTISGKASRARPFQLGRWRHVAAAGAWLYFALGVAAPFLILLWTSLLPYYAGVSSEMVGLLTLDNHREILGNAGVVGAAVNSVVIAVVAATVVAVLSAGVSWVTVRSKAPGRKLFDAISFVPLAIPSTMIGLALIFVYLTINWVPVYGTIWILVIAYVTTYLAFGTRVTNGVLFQISGELEESAHASGAAWWRTFREVTLPLMRPALLAV
jgi:iron(III) transport system permease protein